MSLYRRNPKRDTAEAEVIDTLMALGWSVQRLSCPNCPDAVIGRSGETHLIEIKTGTKPLRPGQAEWIANWNGAPVAVLRNSEDACQLSRGQWPQMQARKASRKRNGAAAEARP